MKQITWGGGNEGEGGGQKSKENFCRLWVNPSPHHPPANLLFICYSGGASDPGVSGTEGKICKNLYYCKMQNF